jgi:hypothetical protein
MEVIAASFLASDKVRMTTLISIFGFKSTGTLEFQYARAPQALPTNLASTLAPVDSEIDAGRGKQKRSTNFAFV